MTINYRESYNLFATSGILFNHESPLRGKEFVTRKITDAVAKIHLGQQEIVELGNLDAQRDWGYAKEYVAGMWKILQVETPESYVLATGRTETVRTFVSMAFKAIAVDLEWQGEAEKEVGIDKNSGQMRVKINPKFYRPSEIDLLIGKPDKARQELAWQAETRLESLCKMMVDADIRRCRQGIHTF